jgi:hypothetical protein
VAFIGSIGLPGSACPDPRCFFNRFPISPNTRAPRKGGPGSTGFSCPFTRLGASGLSAPAVEIYKNVTLDYNFAMYSSYVKESAKQIRDERTHLLKTFKIN